ncbi:hypothetical protein K2Z83_22530 [Oscillochloris sp. ZM17-4]|nr:hypothetical protein [Oscillochloris sp. ZM17-4]
MRALLRRDMRVRQPVLDCVELWLDPATGEVWVAERRVALPRKQLRLLEYMLRCRGEVVSQGQLLEYV